MTWNRTTSAPSRSIALRWTLIGSWCAIAAAGCQNFQLPRIDPSGERLFLPPGAPAPVSPFANVPYGTTPPYNPGVAGAQPPLPGTTVVAPPVLSAPPTPSPSMLPPGMSSPMIQSPLQTPQPTLDLAAPAPSLSEPPSASGQFAAPLSVNPANMAAPALASAPRSPLPGLNVNPNRVVAPVGSEVVMIASLLGSDGYLVSGDDVEWMISGDGAGSFVSPGERGTFDVINRLRGLPRKVNATYVLNATLRSPQVLDRGTPVPFDDLEIQPGQAWVTVTSPVEGTTHLSVYAPNVPQWDRRQQGATIYWVDAQWNFPPPAINPMGTRHTFVTSVNRQSDGSPIDGWSVRYEIVGGPAAQWEATGSTVVEVPTNEIGQASAEIVQVEPLAGTNQITLQVIRPDGKGGRKFVIGTGGTSKTWTRPNICINAIGPSQASVGSTVNYRIEASNPSSVLARNVVVTDDLPRALSLVSSTPPADASPSGQEWRLGDLAPGQMRTIDVSFKVAQAGNFNYCVTITADGGLTAKDCVTTSAEGAGTRPLDVRVHGPSSAIVGSKVQYEIEVINVGTTPATGLVVTDTFDDGLQHSVATSPIERDLSDLQPGQRTQFKVTFQVTRPGQLCQQVEVRGAEGLRSSAARTCLTATTAPSLPRIGEDDGGVTEPGSRDRNERGVRPPPGAASGPQFTVRKTGPVRKRVGETAEFTIEVANTGDVVLNNIRIEDNYERSLEPIAATDGYVISGGSLVWTATGLAPGKALKRQIHCECVQAVRSACNRVSVTAEGLKDAVGDEACLEISRSIDPLRPGDDPDESPPPISPTPIRPDPGAAAPSPTLEPSPRSRGGIAPATGLTLSVGEQVDPVRIGGETNYQVVVSNKNAGGDRQVVLQVRIPENLTLLTAEGPVRARIVERGVNFEPIAELRANESITFQIKCRGVEAGEGRFQVEATSQLQRSPIRAEEPTQVVQ